MDGPFLFMKILITGGSSLLGKYLISTAPDNADIQATWYTNYVSPMHQMDVTNKSQVRYVFDKVKPNLVIHCAANGSVDYAENNWQEVQAVNVGGTENILKVARDYEAKVVYISTNAVFEGINPPYTEDSPRQPVNAYGSIKRHAEQAVMDSKSWVIVRPFMIYGWPWANGRQNWATIVSSKLAKGEGLKVVNDCVWQPTYAKDCAEAIWKLSETDKEVYNVAAPERVSLYDFALKVAEVWELDTKLIEGVSSDYFPTIARRPKDTSYDLKKLDSTGLKLSGIEAGLKQMKAEASE